MFIKDLQESWGGHAVTGQEGMALNCERVELDYTKGRNSLL